MTNKTTNLQDIKEQIARFEELWDQVAVEHNYTYSSELKNIAIQLLFRKLSDDFLLDDLTPEELKIMNEKVYVLALT